MPKRKVLFYLRCVDDTIEVRQSALSMLIVVGSLPRSSATRMVKIKEVTKGNCYKATIYLADPLRLVQLLETERGTLSRSLLQGKGRIKHGCMVHKRFVRITEEEYETWRRSKMQ